MRITAAAALYSSIVFGVAFPLGAIRHLGRDAGDAAGGEERVLYIAGTQSLVVLLQDGIGGPIMNAAQIRLAGDRG
jgi:hypothetical protein